MYHMVHSLVSCEGERGQSPGQLCVRRALARSTIQVRRRQENSLPEPPRRPRPARVRQRTTRAFRSRSSRGLHSIVRIGARRRARRGWSGRRVSSSGLLEVGRAGVACQWESMLGDRQKRYCKEDAPGFPSIANLIHLRPIALAAFASSFSRSAPDHRLLALKTSGRSTA